MWKYCLAAFITLTVTLVLPSSNLVQAKFKFPSDDFANAETKERIYSFDLDFSLVYGEDHDNTLVKNKHPAQDTVIAKAAYLINGDFNSESTNHQINTAKVFLTKDKIKTTSDSVKFGKIYSLRDLQCQNKCISFFGHVPNVKKGTYNLVYVAQADELDKFYITTISIK